MQNSLFNCSIKTPIGEGVVQSRFRVIGDVSQYLVRLPVNELTSAHLKDSNCLTPRASKSGLWVFSQEELKGK